MKSIKYAVQDMGGGVSRCWTQFDTGKIMFSDTDGNLRASFHTEADPPRGLRWIRNSEPTSEPVECCDRTDPPIMVGLPDCDTNAEGRFRCMTSGHLCDIMIDLYRVRRAQGDGVVEAYRAALEIVTDHLR